MKSQLRVSPNEHYKKRVKDIKHLLPKNVREIVFASYPKYLTLDGIQLLNNVLTGSSSDVLLTQILEQVAQNYQIEKAEQVLKSQTLFN